ncbi:MAG: 1-(5-phosphoribosyl)-5-[(5-phosphoribosylamino)methylideneamino]imidazole-4-carboxamide isomerase [Acidaminococcaceae bacterium]|nr:1-(5-phosphoribosyl)-5-[(5-phosphoribosylamino)methylideneamino]imidazole-4-carboxamide isomerase [Acidaminococcaceae bacterium]
MLIYAAIDLYERQAVRLYKGDYAQKTVYNENPLAVAQDFQKQGITHIHLVDLEGALKGTTPNFDLVCKIKNSTQLFCEIGGGIRSMTVIDKYLQAGLDRVILGTAAVTDENLLITALQKYAEKIAVGVDIKDGKVAIKGWTSSSNLDVWTFCYKLQEKGVKTIICTDISKDGVMQGTNRELYKKLSEQLSMNIIASGGVSSLTDIQALKKYNLHGAIVGKAYYTGAIDLAKAVEVAQ